MKIKSGYSLALLFLVLVTFVGCELLGSAGGQDVPGGGDTSQVSGTTWYVNVDAPDSVKTLHVSFADGVANTLAGSWQEVRWVFNADGTFDVFGNPDCYRIYATDPDYDAANAGAIRYPAVLSEEIFWSGIWSESDGYVYLTTTHLPSNGLPNQTRAYALDPARNSYDQERVTNTRTHDDMEYELFEHGDSLEHLTLYSDDTSATDYELGEYVHVVLMYNADGAWD